MKLIRKVVLKMTHLPLRTFLKYTVMIFNIIQDKSLNIYNNTVFLKSIYYTVIILKCSWHQLCFVMMKYIVHQALLGQCRETAQNHEGGSEDDYLLP